MSKGLERILLTPTGVTDVQGKPMAGTMTNVFTTGTGVDRHSARNRDFPARLAGITESLNLAARFPLPTRKQPKLAPIFSKPNRKVPLRQCL